MKIINIIIILIFSIILFGCTKPESSKTLLEQNGYENVQTGGYSWFACSKSDFYQTKFTATMKGNKITGTVCEGFLFKGKTIRFD